MKQLVFICPQCGKSMDCPPGQFFCSHIHLTATCDCGNVIHGLSGSCDGITCIMTEDLQILAQAKVVKLKNA